ncbi:MAG: phosphomannomutase/phosphoglucomutase [Eubacteriaceae bacterium]|nr:phosphomannomutase/phosphoglucomutase [Eubacteriaceae bacterium]
MSRYNFKKLQNGSDIRGIALTGVPGELPDLTDVEAPMITRGFLRWLSEKTGKKTDELKVAVGRDPRSSGQMIKHGVITGFGPYGTTVYDCGIATTPAMFMSTIFPESDCDGAIMLTASHLPWNRNGFKYFDKDGGLQKEDIAQILEYAESEDGNGGLGAPTYPDAHFFILGKKSWPSEEFDLMTLYCDHIKKLITDGLGTTDEPLKGMKIAVDAGNGSGGFFARRVLAPLGADTSSSRYLEPDGTFPNHAPNPEDKAAMNDISLQVLSTGSDFGLIFDTDVDRAAAVDNRGNPISRNGIVALASCLAAEDHPGSIVVTDSITSDHLTDFLENELGLTHFRYKRGYKNVINKAIELNAMGKDCDLAIETSGHAAMKENYFLDDGAYLATMIVIRAAKLHREGKTLGSLLKKLVQPKESREIRMKLSDPDMGDTILEDMRKWAADSGYTVADPSYEGVRISFDEGWCLLRRSLHDPLMPLNIESDIEGGTAEISGKLKDFLKKYTQLDTTNL